jgi:CheY-like chemotaxis protein
MTQRNLLVVDDELINLEIIREYLEGPDYLLDLVGSGDQAWQRLNDAGNRYDIAILDRMMPGMSGIELLRRMKADTRFRAIPVIMQTAATAQEQVREGIEAGAYYYLAKPYEPETLLAIVRAALADIDEHDFAVQRASAHVKAMELMDQATFHFRSLEEIGPLIEVLASLCPAPERAASGLTELLVNAIEHGSLGISYAEKKRLRLENAWEAEVSRRMALPELAERVVRVRVERHFDRLEFTVADEGNGFDWQRYLDFDPVRAADPNGRGIAMARLLSFSCIEYRGNGNTVVATIAKDGLVS